MEHCSPSSFRYAEYFVQRMLQSLGDPSPEVRQAAAYGVGVMAQYGGENYRPFCTGRHRPAAAQTSLISAVKEAMSRPPDAIPLLVGVIHAADARSKENINATENCISAVGKVMRFQPQCVNLNLVLPLWLGWLPLSEDKEEAVHTFDFLCDLIER